MDEGKVIIEAKDSGGVRIALRPAEDGSIWMNVREIADIFNVGGASVERQIKKIFAEGELHEYAVTKDVRIEYAPGKYGTLYYYNLNMIIMLAFRMKSAFCAMFREWITEQLVRKVSEQKIPIVLQISIMQGIN